MTTPQTHRLLSEGEIIQEGDEFEVRGEWMRCTGSIGIAVSKRQVGHYRRPLPAQQHGETPTPRTDSDLIQQLEFFQKNAGYYQSKLEAAQEQVDLYKREVESVIEYMPERFVVKLADHPFGTLAVSAAKLGHAALASVTLEEENKELRAKRSIAITALKAAYARGHYCDMGERCPGCIAGHALEQITGRKWTQEECG